MKEINFNGETKDLLKDNLEELKKLFPELVTEDKIDLDKFKTIFGEEIEEKDERYNFTWNGKLKALRESQKTSTGTLRPCKDESKDWDNTENLYIEGDNLEVLKLLQKTYHNKIKMIYIDPPYNTGKEFIYPDNYKDNLNNYIQLTKQIDEEGNKLSTNTESNGRYHTDWLNMMYPRLRLARNLLKDDGVIFISIDDNEVHNLRKICDEIFGEINFVSSFIKQSKVGGGSDSKHAVKEHEYLLTYAKNIDLLPELFEEHDKEYLKRYKEEDDNGKYFWDTFARPGLSSPIYYDIETPDGTIINNGWIRSKERFLDEYKKGIIRIIKKETGEWSVQFKQYLNSKGKKPRSMTSDFGGTIQGKKEIEKIFGNDRVFTYPKSLVYIKKLIKFVSHSSSDIILDFFSGSATTAHAVMQLNSEDGGNRKYIMVQLPEPTDENSEAFKAGYKNICEIGKERIRRAGEKIKQDLIEKQKKENNKLPNNETKTINPDDLDIGFKVFKLDSSNIKKWNPDIEDIENYLLEYKNNFLKDRTELDVVYEIMIKFGINLSNKVDEYILAHKKVYSIKNGSLLICLEDNITSEIAEEIINLKQKLNPETMKIVFKDNGFKDDSSKTNIKETLKVSGIDEFVSV